MSEVTNEERKWATFCHLGGFAGFIFPFGNIIAPLVIWLLKKEDLPFVEKCGREAVNFQISLAIYAIISVFLCFVFIGFFLLAALGIFSLVVIIKAVVRANKGEFYRYPLAIQFLKSEAAQGARVESRLSRK